MTAEAFLLDRVHAIVTPVFAKVIADVVDEVRRRMMTERARAKAKPVEMEFAVPRGAKNGRRVRSEVASDAPARAPGSASAERVDDVGASEAEVVPTVVAGCARRDGEASPGRSDEDAADARFELDDGAVDAMTDDPLAGDAFVHDPELLLKAVASTMVAPPIETRHRREPPPRSLPSRESRSPSHPSREAVSRVRDPREAQPSHRPSEFREPSYRYAPMDEHEARHIRQIARRSALEALAIPRTPAVVVVRGQPSDMRLLGTIKWFDAARGYGFITSARGIDVFLHSTGLDVEMPRAPVAGTPVSYELERGRKGVVAVRVRARDEGA